MAQRRKGGGPQGKERRVTKKKTSILTTESIEWIDYKDVNLLRRFMSERAKIRARRVTGNDQQQQAAVARAIKVAREMALLPYSVRQVTQRSKGRRDRDRDRGERDVAAESGATDAEAVAADAAATEQAEGVEATEETVGAAADTGAGAGADGEEA
jgi:small subunit ribosomal protein S18